jgi:hypothetical protein
MGPHDDDKGTVDVELGIPRRECSQLKLTSFCAEPFGESSPELQPRAVNGNE